MTARIPLGVGLLAALSWTAPGASQTPITSLRVSVTTTDGQPVTGLTSADFSLVSDGESLPVVSCTEAARAVHLVLLIDATSSVATGPSPSEGALEDAIKRTLLSALGPDDAVRVGGIGATPSMSPTFTIDRATLSQAVHDTLHPSDANRYGPSPIWDAVWAGLAALSATTDQRAILLVTDGRATGDVHGFADTLRQAIRSHTSVTALAIGPWQPEIVTGATTIGLVHPEAQMEQLVRATGGMFLPFAGSRGNTTQTVAALLARALGGWRSGYTLGFDGIADGLPHQVVVRVDHPGLLVRAATFYVADSRTEFHTDAGD